MKRSGLFLLAFLYAFPLAAQQSSPVALAAGEATLESGIIRQVEFVGLRRIAMDAIRAHISVHEGLPLDARQIERDVRALDDLGWFDSVSVRVELLPVQIAAVLGGPPPGLTDRAPGMPPVAFTSSLPLLRLIFVFEERPFLAGVDFVGSSLLDRQEVKRVLASRGLDLKVATPSNRTQLWRASRAIESELAERGRPQAKAHVRLIELPTDAVFAEFHIADGPRIYAGQVDFLGNLAFSDKRLRGRMDSVAPHALFAGLRDKDVFTAERLALDRERIERYYRNHGYPHARLGEAQVEIFKKKIREWLPWPGKKEEERFRISIPVQEGPQYRIDSVRVEGPGLDDLDGLPEGVGSFIPGEPYSEEKILRAQEMLARLPELRKPDGTRHVIDLDQRFDPATGTVRVILRSRATHAYIVRRIEISGHHRFSDRFYRRRVRLVEGDPFDETKLEQGLARLADSGFIERATPESVRLTWDHEKRTVDVHITVEEIGRQRISLLGGAAGWGSTVGVAYNLFDFFGGEELITGQLEGGPASLFTAVQIAREGLFGSRAGAALSFYNSVLRPHMPGSAGRERLFSAHSLGVTQSVTQPVGAEDVLAFRYDLARTTTRTPSAFVPGQTPATVVTRSARSSVGASWTRQNASRRLEVSGAFAGGPLRGNEQTLRGSAEYARLGRDPFSGGRNAWAFRGLVAGVAPHSGATLAVHNRLFGGGQLVRGLRDAELAPYASRTTSDSEGRPHSRVTAIGGDFLVAANSEYRIPLEPANRVQVAAFLDAASAWSLLQLAGGELLQATSGRPRATSGVELRWQLPESLLGMPNPLARETLRLHYAVDVLRWGRKLLLPDGNSFLLPERRSAFGWALGQMF